MRIIGLTGQTGAGKSTVAKILEKQGYYHIDADLIAKQVIDGDCEVKTSLCGFFGEDVLSDDGAVNRQILAKRAFSSAENTEKLSELTHPAVVKRIEEIIAEKESENCIGAVVDAIGLFESGLYRLCEKNICVVADEEIRLKRIMSRDNISRESAQQRISAQKDEAYFVSRCETVIRNNPPCDLEKQIREIFK